MIHRALLSDGDTVEGSLRTYTCSANTVPEGETKIVCQNDGQWSTTSLYCRRNYTILFSNAKSVLLLKEQKIKTLVLKLPKFETSQQQSLMNSFSIRANCSGLWPCTSGGKSGSGRWWNHSGRIHQVLPMYRRLSHGGGNQCNLWERWTLVWRQILLQTYVKMASPKLNDILKDKFSC